MELSLIQKITIAILPILFAIALHEAAHAYVALLCGDKTAKFAGRVTLNPIKHIDLFGSIIVPVLTLAMGGILFGWAKPTPVNERNFRHPKRDAILVSLAGPAANFLMALLWAAVEKFSLPSSSIPASGPFLALALMGQFGISINLFIMLFNLLPIPPLDGARILAALLPPQLSYKYYAWAPYGFFILLALIFIGALNLLIGVPYSILVSIVQSVFGLG